MKVVYCCEQLGRSGNRGRQLQAWLVGQNGMESQARRQLRFCDDDGGSRAA